MKNFNLESCESLIEYFYSHLEELLKTKKHFILYISPHSYYKKNELLIGNDMDNSINIRLHSETIGEYKTSIIETLENMGYTLLSLSGGAYSFSNNHYIFIKNPKDGERYNIRKNSVKINSGLSDISFIIDEINEKILISGIRNVRNLQSRINKSGIFSENNSDKIDKALIRKIKDTDFSIVRFSVSNTRAINITVYDKNGVAKAIGGKFSFNPISFIKTIFDIFNNNQYVCIYGTEDILVMNPVTIIDSLKIVDNYKGISLSNNFFRMDEESIDVIFEKYAELKGYEEMTVKRLKFELLK